MRGYVEMLEREHYNEPSPASETYGDCYCGCGARTALARQSRAKYGQIEGQPLRYIRGHNGRSSPHEYLVDPATGCWEWQRHRGRDGYGKTYVDSRPAMAHRVLYARVYGPIPKGLQLDHLCRNRGCVNPAHLELVVSAENTRRSPRTKLSLQDAQAIRSSELSGPVLAARYGVTRSAIGAIRRGEIWRTPCACEGTAEVEG